MCLIALKSTDKPDLGNLHSSRILSPDTRQLPRSLRTNKGAALEDVSPNSRSGRNRLGAKV